MATPSAREPMSDERQITAPSPRTVLIVEDDPFMRHALSRLLSSDGCTCIAAATVEAAQDLLAAQQPAMVITDLNLGAGLNGIDLLRWMKLSQRLRRLPVLLMTGDDRELTRRQLDRAELADVEILNKPFERDALVALVMARLSG